MKSYLKVYITALVFIILFVGLVNFTFDPLWYGVGNRLTGINFPYNERVSKTNLFLQRQHEKYDCFLFGTSRVTLFHESALQQNHCFNYSFSSGSVKEFANYARYIKSKGANPTKIYVGIEPSSFDASDSLKPASLSFPEIPEITDPLPSYQTYFSIGSLQLSFQSLIGTFIKGSRPRYYDRNFQAQVFETAPKYKPLFRNDAKPKHCDASRIELYKQLRNVFPDATYVGFVPPFSAWFVYNTRYVAGVVDCQLASIYQVADFFDVVYDFSVPSAETRRLDNTYDGGHYYPEIYNEVADVLEGRASHFGVRINDYKKMEDYQQFFTSQLKAFLDAVGEGNRWKE